MSAWRDATPLVFIATGASQSIDRKQEEARVAVQRWVERQQWECRTRRAVPVRLTRSSESGRSMDVLEPRDADELYRALHRRPTAVVQVGSPKVRLDPSAPPSARHSVSLGRFVRYKSYFCQLGRVGAEFQAGGVLDGFSEWLQQCACDGERDARCIPLHAFSPNKEWERLHVAEEVTRFEARHGGATSRTDENERQWRTPNAPHGRESLVVAGASLRTGFHWDVVSPGKSGRLCTSAEVWAFKPGAYCNVYPDAGVRRGQRRGKCAERVFEAERPDKQLKQSKRAPRSSNSRHRR